MKVSVVIPVKNGGHTLGRCLQAIRSQTLQDIEIIVLDSNSSDNSREIAQSFNAEVIKIDQNTFNHGTTRNAGFSRTNGELVFFTVQDAWIAEKDMLEKMSNHFLDPKIMAVTGHQAIPHELDKNPIKWYRRYSESVIQVRSLNDPSDYNHLSQSQKQSLIAWDNVVAMYRKQSLELLPFVATEMSEDWIWSRDALLKGWLLIYDPSLLVYHYHHETFKYVYQVSYSVNYHFYKYFGFVPVLPPIFIQMARATWHILKNRRLSFSKKMYWIMHNYSSLLSKFLVNLDGQFFIKKGGLAALQKRYLNVCKVIPQGKQNVSL